MADDYLSAEEIQSQDWQYFIERILEFSITPQHAIRPKEKFLKSTLENVEIAKKVYRMMFNAVSTNFNLTIPNLNHEKIKTINEDFFLKKYSYSSALTNLNDWISYYYSFGRFLGSNDFINVPYITKPNFLRTDSDLSPATLHQKFASSDVAGVISFHALCALNIYLGGNKNISAVAYGEFLRNMTYQALSDENDEINLSFDQSVELAHSIVNSLADLAKDKNMEILEINDKIDDALNFDFDEKEEGQLTPPPSLDAPIATSTPMTDVEIKTVYDWEKANFINSSLQINSEDLELAAERADIDNQKLFQEIIDPAPGLIIDNKLDVDKQFHDQPD